MLVPYAIASIVQAATSFCRSVQQRTKDLGHLGLLMGQIFLVGGVFWLTVAVTQAQFLNYSGLAALLTSNHFHFAGFSAVTVSARLLLAAPTNRWFKISTLGLIIGLPSVAVGITLAGTDANYRSLEVTAALGESVALFCLGCGSAQFAQSSANLLGFPRFGFLIVGFSACLASLLSAAFCLRGFAALDQGWLTAMVIGHGSLNLLGVSLGGLYLVGALPTESSDSLQRFKDSDRTNGAVSPGEIGRKE